MIDAFRVGWDGTDPAGSGMLGFFIEFSAMLRNVQSFKDQQKGTALVLELKPPTPLRYP